jgi:enterochelin esterase family protein
VRQLLLITITAIATAAEDYPLGPDSQPQPGVPQGEVKKFTFESGRIFPGTKREWSLYVPRQYNDAKPACAMVFFDGGGFAKPGGQFRVPVVFDNLIAKKEMPVTVGIFINPGSIPGAEPGRGSRSNRSYEYDSMNDLNARFVVEEIIPEVRKLVKLTDDPAGWGTCGASSGGIAAFTLAWEKPDHFRKVISYIGSFTNIRGGHDYPALVRKSKNAPKPLRVFLQDGAADLDNLHGLWPLSNKDMAAALKFAGYDYKFELGTGGHSGGQGGAILPDVLRWLWRDWPKEK